MRISIIILVLLGVAALYARFPYQLQDGQFQNLVYLVGLLVVIILTTRRFNWQSMSRNARDMLAWGCIMIVLVLGYSFRERLQGEFMPQQVRTLQDGTVEVHASEGGHFIIEGLVNEVYVRFMVDTGASDIVLSPEDARRAGIAVNSLTFDKEYGTANGYGMGAPVQLDSLSIGGIHLHDVPASVNKAQMSSSLLGMSFLKRLHSFRVEGNTLVLIP